MDRKENAELLTGTDQIVFPNGLAVDVRGNNSVAVLTRNAVVRLVADTRSQESSAVLGSPGPVPLALVKVDVRPGVQAAR